MSAPKIRILSDEPDDIAWAGWAAKKLVALKNVIRGSFRKYFAPESGVLVEITHVDGQDTQDAVLVRREPLEYWAGGAADIPNGRFVDVAVTNGTFTYSLTHTNIVTTPVGTGSTTTWTVEARIDGVLVGTAQGQYDYFHGFIGDPEMPVRRTVNTAYHTPNCVNLPSGRLCTAERPASMSPMALYSSDMTFVWSGVGWDVTSWGDSWSDPFGAAYFAAAAAAQDKRRIKVITSDGQELASEGYSLGPNDQPLTVPATTTEWFGNSSWDIYNMPAAPGTNRAGVEYSYGGFAYGATFSHTLNFVVPEDVCGPMDGPAPQHVVPIIIPDTAFGGFYPSVVAQDGTFYIQYNSATTLEDQPLGTYIGDDPYVSDACITAWGTLAGKPWVNNPDVADWGAKWVHGLRISRQRERARRKKEFYALVARLVAGDSSWIRESLHTAHPKSLGTYMEPQMTVSSSQSANTATSPNIDRARTTVMSYQYVDADGETRTDSQTVTGRYTKTYTTCTAPGGYTKQYVTEEWVNWLPAMADGTSGYAGDFTFLHDSGRGLLQITDGTIVSGATSYVDLLNDGKQYSPPYPMSSSAITHSYPDILRRYRERAAKKYVRTGRSTNMLDTTFTDGELIDIIPISVQHAEYGDLGGLPITYDVTDTVKLSFSAYIRVTFRYTYLDGSLALVGAYPLKITDAETAREATKDDPVMFPYSADYEGLAFAYRCRKAPWPDLKAAYKDQMANLGDEYVFKALKDAL